MENTLLIQSIKSGESTKVPNLQTRDDVIDAECASVSLKVGSIYFLKNQWLIKYECEFCGKDFRLHKDFLQHSFKHVLESWQRKINNLLEQTIEADLTHDSSANLNDTTYNEALSEIRDLRDLREVVKEEPVYNENDEEEDEELQTMNCLAVEYSDQDKSQDIQLETEGTETKVHLNAFSDADMALPPSHTCNCCDKRFTTSTGLKMHMRTHNLMINGPQQSRFSLVRKNDRPYGCDECGKRFFKSILLKRHKSMHANEKPFKCEICEKNFSQKTALVQHKKLHSDDFSYKCPYCEKSFKQNAGLYCHIRSNHKNK